MLSAGVAGAKLLSAGVAGAKLLSAGVCSMESAGVDGTGVREMVDPGVDGRSSSSRSGVLLGFHTSALGVYSMPGVPVAMPSY